MSKAAVDPKDIQKLDKVDKSQVKTEHKANNDLPDKRRLKSGYARKRTGNISLYEVELIGKVTRGQDRFAGEPLPKNTRRLKAAH